MRVVASESAVQSIKEGGGRLYVWTKKDRCCGAGIRLVSASSPPTGMEFRPVDGADFELYLPSSLTRLPEELHLDRHRFGRRVEAYWNGCAWVV